MALSPTSPFRLTRAISMVLGSLLLMLGALVIWSDSGHPGRLAPTSGAATELSSSENDAKITEDLQRLHESMSNLGNFAKFYSAIYKDSSDSGDKWRVKAAGGVSNTASLLGSISTLVVGFLGKSPDKAYAKAIVATQNQINAALSRMATKLGSLQGAIDIDFGRMKLTPNAARLQVAQAALARYLGSNRTDLDKKVLKKTVDVGETAIAWISLVECLLGESSGAMGSLCVSSGGRDIFTQVLYGSTNYARPALMLWFAMYHQALAENGLTALSTVAELSKINNPLSSEEQKKLIRVSSLISNRTDDIKRNWKTKYVPEMLQKLRADCLRSGMGVAEVKKCGRYILDTAWESLEKYYFTDGLDLELGARQRAMVMTGGMLAAYMTTRQNLLQAPQMNVVDPSWNKWQDSLKWTDSWRSSDGKLKMDTLLFFTNHTGSLGALRSTSCSSKLNMAYRYMSDQMPLETGPLTFQAAKQCLSEALYQWGPLTIRDVRERTLLLGQDPVKVAILEPQILQTPILSCLSNPFCHKWSWNCGSWQHHRSHGAWVQTHNPSEAAIATGCTNKRKAQNKQYKPSQLGLVVAIPAPFEIDSELIRKYGSTLYATGCKAAADVNETAIAKHAEVWKDQLDSEVLEAMYELCTRGQSPCSSADGEDRRDVGPTSSCAKQSSWTYPDSSRAKDATGSDVLPPPNFPPPEPHSPDSPATPPPSSPRDAAWWLQRTADMLSVAGAIAAFGFPPAAVALEAAAGVMSLVSSLTGHASHVVADALHTLLKSVCDNVRALQTRIESIESRVDDLALRSVLQGQDNPTQRLSGFSRQWSSFVDELLSKNDTKAAKESLKQKEKAFKKAGIDEAIRAWTLVSGCLGGDNIDCIFGDRLPFDAFLYTGVAGPSQTQYPRPIQMVQGFNFYYGLLQTSGAAICQYAKIFWDDRREGCAALPEYQRGLTRVIEQFQRSLGRMKKDWFESISGGRMPSVITGLLQQVAEIPNQSVATKTKQAADRINFELETYYTANPKMRELLGLERWMVIIYPKDARPFYAGWRVHRDDGSQFWPVFNLAEWTDRDNVWVGNAFQGDFLVAYLFGRANETLALGALKWCDGDCWRNIDPFLGKLAPIRDCNGGECPNSYACYSECNGGESMYARRFPRDPRLHYGDPHPSSWLGASNMIQPMTYDERQRCAKMPDLDLSCGVVRGGQVAPQIRTQPIEERDGQCTTLCVVEGYT